MGSSDSVSVRACGLLCCSVPVLTTLTFQSDHCSGSFNSLPCSLLLLPFQHSPYLVLLKLSSSIKLFTCQKPSSWPSRPFQTCLHRLLNLEHTELGGRQLGETTRGVSLSTASYCSQSDGPPSYLVFTALFWAPYLVPQGTFFTSSVWSVVWK